MKEIKAWLSDAGNIYTSAAACAHADGLVKCKNCNTDGLEKYEHRTPYPSGLPDSGWVDDTIEIKLRTCKRCHGLSYIKINIEDDPDYQTYIKLKDKFKDLK